MKEYTIKEISNLFNVPSSTLRYYEDIGLLVNVGRTNNNQRIYTEEHLSRLKAIDCFKNTGLPITKMLDFFKYENNLAENIDNIITLVTEHEKSINEQLQKMQQSLLHIQQKVRYYNGIKEAIDTDSNWPSWDDYNI
ncbi:MAG: MerR family transcriptional regulator [Lachnospiraceae bacterium]|nr:MerR family transcriptional regulator [Lachnospiraceae bacterium]